MLVLSRKRGEQVVIDGPCVVSLVEIRGDKVRLGFDADRSVKIDRREVRDLIVAQNAHHESKLAEARWREDAE
jgi:carbon storage regulator